MYMSFFGFDRKPFQLTPDPEFLFMSRQHRKAATYLSYGMAENVGFILITGEIGAGKTTILRRVIRDLPDDVRLARVNNTKVSSDQLIAMICEDFGVNTSGCDKTKMLSRLTDFIIQTFSQGRRSVLVIDEAQNLSPDLLEEIRLLSNLETDKAKLLQIVLVGQPELNATLSRPGLAQLRQRLAVTAHIGPLSREETEEYVCHRLKVAGNAEAVSLEEGVFDRFFAFSGGVPRLINILGDFMLLSAFAESRKEIDIPLIDEIISDFTMDRPEARVPQPTVPDTGKEDTASAVKQMLATIQFRMQGLEAAVDELQRRIDVAQLSGETIAVRDRFLGQREEDLVKREYELTEKENLLRRREDEMRIRLGQQQGPQER